MKELTVMQEQGYRYLLEDTNKTKYDLNIEIINSNYKISVGDVLYIYENMLDNPVLTFGPADSEYGREVQINDYNEIVIFERGKNRVYLKRIYG